MTDEHLKVLIGIALVLGVAIPLVILGMFKKRGLDVWSPSTPLVLSALQQRRIRTLSSIRRVSWTALAVTFVGTIMTPENTQVRMIGAFCLSLGMVICTRGLILVVKREARMGGRGVGTHVVRGVSAVVTGWLIVVLGALVALFGLAAAVLPFGFFS